MALPKVVIVGRPNVGKSSLFNWLAAHVGGARVLDLFAGTGALGLEALSRGAREAVFCERDAGLSAALRANLLRLRQDGRGRVINDDALLALPAQDPAFDLVFLDPPFAAELWSAAAGLIERRGLLAATGMVYVEAPLSAAPALPSNWVLHRETRAGDVRAALYRRDAAMA